MMEEPVKSERRRLTRNAARCLRCNTAIESKSRHDFQRCACGAIFVDGGLTYPRFGWTDGEEFEPLEEWEEVEDEG